jgi:redox-sensitive bicupin YhaK (pirin superfamily)
LDGAVTIHEDVRVFVARLAAGQQVSHDLVPGRHAWVQVARGAASVNGTALAAGDGAAASDERSLALQATAPTEVLVFDLG